MKRLLLALLCGAVIAVAVWRVSTTPGNGKEASGASVALTAEADVARDSRRANLNARKVPGFAAESRAKMAIGDGMFHPKTDEEVAWLVRNGHPTLEEYQAALSAAPSMANIDASDGITPTEIVHATAVATRVPGEADAAKAFIQEAAIQGSIYALHSMGEVLGDPSHANGVQSEAYRRAAILRGDWNASLFYGQPMASKRADLLATLMAQQILNNIDATRRSRGWGALDRDPRPGLNDVLKEAATNGGPTANQEGGS